MGITLRELRKFEELHTLESVTYLFTIPIGVPTGLVYRFAEFPRADALG